jgi:hypothetical protein
MDQTNQMDQEEALESLAGLASILFGNSERAWAFEIRDEDLHAVCVRCPSPGERDASLDWIAARLGGLRGEPGFFFRGDAPGELFLMTVRASGVLDPVSAEARLKQAIVMQKVPVLLLHRPAPLLN